MYLWLAAAVVTIIFAGIMFNHSNTTKGSYLLLLAFFCGLMFAINKKRINKIQ
jgi:tryptophan-rich sensory protein